jgi:DNA modification methylase
LSGKSNIEVKLYFQDTLTVDNSTLYYDVVLTSPPYYNIKQYNTVIKTIKLW